VVPSDTPPFALGRDVVAEPPIQRSRADSSAVTTAAHADVLQSEALPNANAIA
jgi:hypothetical protein